MLCCTHCCCYRYFERKKEEEPAGGADSNVRHPTYASPVCLEEVSSLYKPMGDLMATGPSESQPLALAHRVDFSAGRIRPRVGCIFASYLSYAAII